MDRFGAAGAFRGPTEGRGLGAPSLREGPALRDRVNAQAEGPALREAQAPALRADRVCAQNRKRTDSTRLAVGCIRLG